MAVVMGTAVIRHLVLTIAASVRDWRESESATRRNGVVSNSSRPPSIDLLAKSVVRRASVQVSRSAPERSVSVGAEI
jgi:hypothetical protein